MAEEQKTMAEEEKREKMLQEYPSVIREMAGVEAQNESENIALQDWNKPVTEPEKVFAGLTRGDVGMLVAPGDTGKSYFALYISLLTASTMDFEDPFCVAHGRKVLYINYEDRPIEFVKRQRYIVSSIKNMLSENQIPMQEQEIINSFKDNFFAVSPKKTFFLFKEQRGTLQKITENFERLKEMSAGKDVLILDTWSRSALISDVNNQIASEAIAILEEFAKKENIAILILYQTNKDVCATPYCDVDYVLQIQRLTKSSNVEMFGNKKLIEYADFLNNEEKNSNVEASNNKELTEHLDIRDRILIYERKNNYGQKKACIYVRDNMGALLVFQEPFEVFI